LFNRFSGILVSTSANISDHPPMNNPLQILETFGNKDLAYYDAELGTSVKPSTIIDLETRKIIRE
jgi:tRNA A37 threonylcarbamoyladenosine synthetase subunit TsaC/SUA5/YrdC